MGVVKNAQRVAVWSVLITKRYSGHQFTKNELGGPRGTRVEGRAAYRVLVRRPDGNWPLKRPRRKWEYSFLDFIYTNQCTFYTQMYQSFKYTLKSLKTL